jgi:hypothetical protein
MAPTPNDDLNDLFESPSLDFELPISPTPRRPNARFNIHERRLSLPSNSPTANRRKDVGSATPSTRLTAERLQRIQEGQDQARTTPRQNRTPSKQDMPSLLDPAAFESFDGMILDIFDNAPGQSDFFELGGSKADNQNWAEWLPTDYVSPTGSDNAEASEDFINAILSNPTALKENIHNSQFNPFAFTDAQVPDSGFFSSDALHADSMGMPKPQHANEQLNGQQAMSPTA